MAALGVVAGTWLKRRLPLLDRLNVPTPIVGGMLYAVAALGLHDRVANMEADVVLRDLLMVAFMTTIGLSARVQLIREGGAQVVWFLGIASLGAVLQNLLGIGLAHALGVDPRLGMLTARWRWPGVRRRRWPSAGRSKRWACRAPRRWPSRRRRSGSRWRG